MSQKTAPIPASSPPARPRTRPKSREREGRLCPSTLLFPSLCVHCAEPGSYLAAAIPPTTGAGPGPAPRLYECALCHREEQKLRSLRFVREALAFFLSFSCVTAYALSTAQIRRNELFFITLLSVPLSRLFAFLLFPLKGGDTLHCQAKDGAFLIGPLPRAYLEKLDQEPEVVRAPLPAPSTFLAQVFQGKSAPAAAVALLLNLLWIAILSSTGVEMRAYQGTWGSLDLVVDHRKLTTLSPSAQEDPRNTRRVLLWPGQHQFELVDPDGRVVAHAEADLRRGQSYFLAELPPEQCVILQTQHYEAAGDKTRKSFPLPEGGFYTLPPIHQYLAPLKQRESSWEQALASLLPGRQTRRALRILPCSASQESL